VPSGACLLDTIQVAGGCAEKLTRRSAHRASASTALSACYRFGRIASATEQRHFDTCTSQSCVLSADAWHVFVLLAGGTIARSGGYIAGKKLFVRAAANRLAAPGQYYLSTAYTTFSYCTVMLAPHCCCSLVVTAVRKQALMSVLVHQRVRTVRTAPLCVHYTSLQLRIYSLTDSSNYDHIVTTATVTITINTGVAGGATLGQNRNLYQGLFMASGIVGESLKGANLLAEVLGSQFGLSTNPAPGSPRTDIIQSIQLETREVSVELRYSNDVRYCSSIDSGSSRSVYICATCDVA
jgi:Methionine gamma-lyase